MKMFETSCFFLLMSVFVLLTASRLNGMDDEKLKKNVAESQEATNAWLAIADQGNYGGSWDAGSKTFQSTIKKEEWIKALENLRGPLGKVKSRDILDIRWAADPKGLPKGDYMIFFYKSTFERKDKAFELVTLIQETDGKWRVLTYEIQ